MYGVTKGVYYCNHERVEELNDRIMDRNIPSNQLQMQFDPRPVETRRVLFPGIDCHMPSNTPIQIQPTFNSTSQFNPGTSAPYSGYATKIDDDSKVKDIMMSNQKWCSQSRYIPSSTSDMYSVNVPTTQNIQSHPLLFKQESFSPFNPNKCNMGYKVLQNHTRQQIQNIPLKR